MVEILLYLEVDGMEHYGGQEIQSKIIIKKL